MFWHETCKIELKRYIFASSFQMMQRKPTNTARIFSLLLTGLMLLVSVWSKHVSASPKVEKAKTEQSKKSKDAKQTTISELSPMATGSVIALDCQPSYEFLPPASFVFSTEISTLPACTKPLFRSSYFLNLFGNYIAPNAP